MGFITSIVFFNDVYSSGVWLGVDLRTDIKKCVFKEHSSFDDVKALLNKIHSMCLNFKIQKLLRFENWYIQPTVLT